MATPRKKTKKASPTKTASSKTKSSAKSGAAKGKSAATAKSAARASSKSKAAESRTQTADKSPPRAAREERPEKPSPPAKPAVDAQWQAEMREALATQRQRLLAVVQTTQAQMAEKSGDLADVSDRASEGFEDELDMGLMAIEAAQLEDIEAAIRRIDDGSYGLCANCGKAIPRKRLEVLPFARRCLACEGENERRAKTVEASDEEEDWD